MNGRDKSDYGRAMSDRDQHRIAKLLARAGVASRREVERMIADGRVAKDGVVLDTPATVLPSLHGVTVDGEPVEAPEPARLFLYHKPPGLLVTERDPGGRPTIYDRLPTTLPRVVPVGRLDLATEGLLLLTTDGGLKRQLELPATGVERAYRARAYGPITQARLEELIEGVEIEGIRYGSINANLERRTGANVWIELILTEGKNREVRRVLEHLGLRVSRLIRTRYGPFVLGDLPPGEVGEIRRHDVESFRKHPTRLDLPQPARGQSAVAPVARAGVAAPKPLRQPMVASVPPPQARPARVREDRREPSARAPEVSGVVAHSPEARFGKADEAAKGNPPGASRSRATRAQTAPAPPKAGGEGIARAPRVKHFRQAPTSSPRAPSTADASSKRAFGKPDRTGKSASPARAARAQAHRTATGRADASPAAPAPRRPPAKRPGPPRPPRTRK